MSNTLALFQFNSKCVRVIMRDGEPWFVAKDLCDVLEIINVSQASSRVNEDEKGFHTVQTDGGLQRLSVVSEMGAYKIIMSSRKPGIEKLQEAMLQSLKGSRLILEALDSFEVPEDIGEMFVYAIREVESGRVKLGISRDPHARLRQLQTGNSQRLELVGYRKAENRFQDEAALHSRYADKHIRGEWYAETVAL